MKLRKKVLATTVAASLMVGSISGLPLSTQGALAKLGISAPIVQAAETGDFSYFQQFINELNKDAAGRAAMIAINEHINADRNDDTYSDSFYADMVDPIVKKVINRIEEALDVEVVEGNDDFGVMLFEVISKIMYPIHSDDSSNEAVHWEQVIAEPHYRGLVNQLAKLATDDPLAPGKSDFDLPDIVAYGEALEQALQEQLNMTNLLELISGFERGNVLEALRTAVNNAYNNVSDTKLGAILNTIGVTADDLLKSMRNIAAHYDEDQAGLIAMGSAIARTQLNFTKTTENNGRTAKPSLKFQGLDIASILDWSTSSSQITFDKGAKAFQLASNVNSHSTTIEGRFINEDSDLNVLLYKGTLDMEYTGGYYGGGGGGGGGVPSTPEPEYKLPEDTATIVDNTRGAIDQAKEQLQGATQDQREAIIAEVRAQMEATIAALANVDVSAAVEVDGNSAKATINVAKLEQEIKKITEEIAKLNEELKALDRSAANLKAEITLNFGNIEADNVELTIPKQAMEAAKANGLTHVAIQVNGVAIAYGVNDYQAEIKVNINKQENSVATGVTSLPLASGVYEFHFNVDGEQVTSFASPIELRLPVSDLGNLDEELLSVAKIVNGTIIIYGGQYNPDSKTVNVARNSLSIYTVVENRVEFTDIAPVQAWAGRSIQVAAAKGIINGRGDRVFDPQESVTRAEFAKMIVLAFGLEDATATHNFTDVNSSDWYDQYVAAAVKAGIVRGRSADSFEPNGTITRAEMATMAARALVITGKARYIMNVDEALSVFGDMADIHSSMKDAVALAAKLGIVVGENNQFSPNNISTRAQAAVIIYRLLQQ